MGIKEVYRYEVRCDAHAGPACEYGTAYESENRHEASARALVDGWAVDDGEWSCPQCQASTTAGPLDATDARKGGGA